VAELALEKMVPTNRFLVSDQAVYSMDAVDGMTCRILGTLSSRTVLPESSCVGQPS
jgi:hypothetical protein